MGYLDKQIHRSENVRLNQAPANFHTRPTQNCVPDIAKPRNLYRALQVELPPRPPVQYQPRRHWNVDRISYENGTCTIDENAIVHEVSNPIAADNGSLSSNTDSRNISYYDRSPRTPREHPIENQSFSGTPRDTEWTHLPKRSGFYSERKSSCRTANHRIPPPSSSMKDAATIDGKNPADTLVDLQNSIDRHRRQTYSPKEHVMVDLMKSSSSFPEHVAVNEKMQLAVSPVEHVNILGEYSLHRVNAWSGDRSSSGSNSYGGLVHNPSSTGLQRGSSGSSFADSLYSSDFPLTNYSPSLSPNVADSAFFNAFHEERKYDDTRQCGESEKNWAQQTEESYNLQLTLALRLTAEASLAEDLHFLGRHVQATPNISCTGSAKKSAVALSHRFWINGSLSYYDKIQDGFYHICGLNPYVWTMCNNVEESGQMPSLESLRSVDASDSPIEVVLIDKQGDSHWRELEIKALGLASCCSSTEVVVKQLGKLVCMLMGGPYSTEHGDLKTRWQVTSKMLKDCLKSVVLPIGCISVGLCRHRALLFKALADIIDLPCRIAQGCKYCGMSDGSSCLIQCGLDRECLVDLIGKPGELCDSYMKDIISGSIASPLRLPESKPLHVTNEVRSLARQYASDNKSLGGLLNVPSSRQVAGPMEDGTRVSFAASLNHIDTVPVVSSCITCTGTEACAECSNATNFAGNLSVQNVAFLRLKEELRGTVDENEASHECISPTGTNGTKYNNLPDLCPHVDGEKAKILVDTKSNNDHFLQRPLQVNKKDDLHAKTNKDSFDHKCLEVHKHRVEHGKTGDTECLQETVLQSYKHIYEQSKLKDCLHRNNDKRLEEAECVLQNRSTLELSLAMDGLEIPWEDLILKERIGAGSFGTVHHADWHGSDVAVKILIDQEIHEERLKEFLREHTSQHFAGRGSSSIYLSACSSGSKTMSDTESYEPSDDHSSATEVVVQQRVPKRGGHHRRQEPTSLAALQACPLAMNGFRYMSCFQFCERLSHIQHHSELARLFVLHLHDGQVTLAGVNFVLSPEMISEATGIPNVGEVWPKRKLLDFIFFEPYVRPSFVSHLSGIFPSRFLRAEYVSIMKLIMQYFTCDGRFSLVSTCHIRMLMHFTRVRMMNIPVFFCQDFQRMSSIFQRRTPAQQHRSLCDHGLIQLIVSHQLRQQGISWADFISHEVFTATSRPQPEPQRGQPEPQIIHEEGGPSRQAEIIVPTHVVSPLQYTYQRGHRTLFAAARQVFSPHQVEGVSSSSSDQRVLSPHQVEGASLSTAAQVAERGKQPMIEDERAGDTRHDFIDFDAHSPSSDFYELIRQREEENLVLQQRLEMAQWTITYLEQRNRQLEAEKELDELWRIRGNRGLNRRRPGDPLPADRESMLIQVNAHLERLLEKANRDKRLLRNMKNHYWARLHVCKAKMKILQRKLSEARKRRKKTNPLRILAEASLTHHDTD